MYIRVDDGQPLQVLQSCQRSTRATKSMFWMVCPTMLQACQQQYLVARMSDVTTMSRKFILDWNDFRLVCQRTLHACQTSVYTHLGLLNVLLTVFVSMLSVYSDCYCLQAANRILWPKCGKLKEPTYSQLHGGDARELLTCRIILPLAPWKQYCRLLGMADLPAYRRVQHQAPGANLLPSSLCLSGSSVTQR